MEDVVQRIFAILISVLIFFLLPLYIAFEKKDDISYALALKVTNSFADNVVNKGYLTYDMYTQYVTDLAITGNVYDISLEYVAKQYNPIIQVREETDNGINIVEEYDYLEVQEKFNTNKSQLIPSTVIDKNKCSVELTYKLSELKYTTDQIIEYLDNSSNTYLSDIDYNDSIDSHPTFPRIYGLKSEGLLVMNEGDQFNVIIKNTNTTIATVLFNTLTFGANAGNDTKVYINYGGTVKNQEYMPKLMGDVDNNGIVDQRDKDLVKDYVENNAILTLKQKIAADINKDGILDSLDYE